MTCAVFFNLDDTLTEMTKEYEEIYEEAVSEAGLDDLADRYGEYKDLFFKFFQDNWAFPRRQAMDKIVRERSDYDPDRVEDFVEAWERFEAEAVQLKPGVLEVLEGLDGTYPLGIISNGTGKLQRMKLQHLGIENHFQHVLVSSEVGSLKPEQYIFDRAKETVSADTYVMVSHHPKRDVVPARKFGFEAVWISSSEKDVPEKIATKIGDINGLPDALDDLCGDGA